MFRLFLVRHGETLENVRGFMQGHSDSELTAKGKRQTAALAKRLRKEKITAVYASDLERSHQTALAIAKYHPKVKLVTTRHVRERAFGKHEGVRFDEFLKRYPLFFSTHRVKTVETSGQVRKRAKAFLAFLHRKYPDGTVVVVGHAAFNNALIAALTNTALDRPWFAQDNACVNELAYDGKFRIWIVEKVNDTGHLARA